MDFVEAVHFFVDAVRFFVEPVRFFVEAVRFFPIEWVKHRTRHRKNAALLLRLRIDAIWRGDIGSLAIHKKQLQTYRGVLLSLIKSSPVMVVYQLTDSIRKPSSSP
jgi:hypothetical protein